MLKTKTGKNLTTVINLIVINISCYNKRKTSYIWKLCTCVNK